MIAIKDMEMPKDCISCPMQEYESNIGRTRCTATCRILSEHHIPIPSDVKPDFCPLIEIKTDGDMISRQQTIDALMQEFRRIPTNSIRAKTVVENLPSAQPERTCVNCGRTANNGGWYADGGTRCPIEEHYALPKDGYCHLWEKRNVTDDDYPERRTDEKKDI